MNKFGALMGSLWVIYIATVVEGVRIILIEVDVIEKCNNRGVHIWKCGTDTASKC